MILEIIFKIKMNIYHKGSSSITFDFFTILNAGVADDARNAKIPPLADFIFPCIIISWDYCCVDYNSSHQ